MKDEEKAETFNDYFSSISQISSPFAEVDEPLVNCEYELSNTFIS